MILGKRLILDKNVTIPLLMDLYGNTLTKSKFEDLYSYYSEDLSLSEIASNTGKSRQAVFDSIKHSESALFKIEEELGFLKKIDSIKSDFAKIKETAQKLQVLIKLETDDKSSEYLKDILRITEKYIDD